MLALGVNHTREELDALFDYFDKDGDGTLDYVEIFRTLFDKQRVGKRTWVSPTASVMNESSPRPSSWQGKVIASRRYDSEGDTDAEDDVGESVEEAFQRSLP